MDHLTIEIPDGWSDEQKSKVQGLFTVLAARVVELIRSHPDMPFTEALEQAQQDTNTRQHLYQVFA